MGRDVVSYLAGLLDASNIPSSMLCQIPREIEIGQELSCRAIPNEILESEDCSKKCKGAGPEGYSDSRQLESFEPSAHRLRADCST